MKKTGIGIVFLVVIIGLLFYIWNNRPPTPSATPAENNYLQTFSSNVLGISLLYDPATTGILEQNSTVYIYSTGTTPLEGQWIKYFNKSPEETFTQSIERQILVGFSTSTCTVKVTQLRDYERAEILYPEPEDTSAPFWQRASECNDAYAKTNGIRYFLYDPAHSDRFYFVSIGQYPIIATGTITWQDTISIGNRE